MSLVNRLRKVASKLSYPDFENCGPLELLVLQATPFCNIDCSYCYLKNRDWKNRMSDAVIEAVFRRLDECDLVQAPYTVAWHAGEPLVLGVEYYRKAFEIIRKFAPKRHEYYYSIQTNGILITDDWIEFFREYDVRIGVSIDGPKIINDRHRVTRNGGGTADRVIDSMKKLKKNNIKFHTISVVTRESLDYAAEIYCFLRENGSDYICFNVEEIEAGNECSTLAYGDGADSKSRFTKFIGEVYDEMKNSDTPIRVREIEGAMDAITGWNGYSRGLIVGDSQQIFPFKIINVDVDGNYSTYSPELLGEQSDIYGTFNIGNVLNDSFRQGYDSERFRAMYHDLQRGVDKCRASCGYFQFCGGGTPANKFYENGSLDSAETMFCRLHRQAVIDGVINKIATPV